MRHNYTDSAEGLFVQREVSRLLPQVYETPFADTLHRDLFPVDFSGTPGESEVSFKVMTLAGKARIMANGGKDLPFVNAFMEERKYRVHAVGDQYSYTKQDVRKARMSNTPLDATMLRAARQAILRKEADLCFFGDRQYNSRGIIEHPETIEVTFPTDGDSSSAVWEKKVADQLLRDLNLLANASRSLTNEIEVPDTLLLSPEAHRLIRTTPLGDNRDKSILSYFREVNPNITSVVAVPKLSGAAADRSDVAICYKRDPSKIFLYVPMEFTAYPAQEEGLNYNIPCEMETAGLIIVWPRSIAWAKTSAPRQGITRMMARREDIGSNDDTRIDRAKSKKKEGE